MDFQTVNEFIVNNMLYKERWVECSDADKQIVVNNAEMVLYRELPHHFNIERSPIPLDILAEQCIHVLEFDDSHRRAEMGVSYFMASGLYVSFDKAYNDRSIARTILHRYPRRRTGKSIVQRGDNYRHFTNTKLADNYRPPTNTTDGDL
ncbi:hypothetical protein ABEX38_29890 [Priestia megaterium]